MYGKNIDLRTTGNGSHALKLARAKQWLGRRWVLAEPVKRQTQRKSAPMLAQRWDILNGR